MFKSSHTREWKCHLRAETYYSKLYRKFILKPNRFLAHLCDLISSVNLGVKNYV